MWKHLGIIILAGFFLPPLAGARTSRSMGTLEIPITPFSNMASGYQATNPGFRAILKTTSGMFLGGGPLTIDSAINGYSDDASQGSAYGKLVLSVSLAESEMLLADGSYDGVLSICMAEDTTASMINTKCKSLSGNIHPERPFQWIDKNVSFQVKGHTLQITHYDGETGEGGTSEQIALAAFHPAFGFAAPGKAFKDYQSPLVLDLDHNGKIDLLNVWNDEFPVRFDLNGTGEKIRTGWVKATDGLLFWDNGTGCVQSGSQLYGEYTFSQDGVKNFNNGFEALAAQFDQEGTGKVVASLHPDLKIWRNFAQDGICKPNEVFPATDFVKVFNLKYETVANVALTEDNEIRLTGIYVGTDSKSHLIADVWFKQRRHDLAKNFNH